MKQNVQNHPCSSIVLTDRWAHAFVERRGRAGEIVGRWEIIDLDGDLEKSHGSNLRYPSESYGSIRCTCLAALTILPPYGAAYMFWHTVRTPFSAVSIFFHTLEELLTRPRLSVFANLALLPIKHALKSVWMVVRTPIYILAMQSAALYGFVRPLEGRQYLASIEKRWRGSAPFELDFHREYLLKTFQPYGTLNDPSVVSVQFVECSDSVG